MTSHTPIIFNLKRKWHDAIAQGYKRIEYRDIKPYWSKRLSDAHLRRANNRCIFRLGYDPSHDIPATITRIDVGGCPYEGWNDLYYRIHFQLDTDTAKERQHG